MASIVRSATGWRVRYRTPDGATRGKTFARKAEAVRFRNKLGHDIDTGNFVDPRNGRVPFDEWWETWWAGVVDLRLSTRARDESYCRNHVSPKFGSMLLCDIEHAAVREWVAELAGSSLAPATVHKCHQILAKTLRGAVQAGMLPSNPADGVKLPKVERVEMGFLDADNVETLASAIDPAYRAFVLLGAYSGLRLGEMLALRVRRFDPMKRTVHVAETLVDVRGTLHFGPPKTRAARRTVPLTRDVSDALVEHLAARNVADEPDALVFVAPQGGPVRHSLFRRRAWEPACVAAGLAVVEKDEKGKRKRYVGLRIHDLRHTAVAMWIAAGAAPNEVAKRAGHTSVVTVLDRYGHLLPGTAEDVTDKLQARSSKAAADAKRKAAKVATVTPIAG
jgi:integrase